jgi:acyl-CoA-binding protein
MKLTNEQQLEMYALFKQATTGSCNTKQPSRLQVYAVYSLPVADKFTAICSRDLQIVERAKWDAWKKLGSMSKEEAMKRYVEVHPFECRESYSYAFKALTKLAPNWEKQAKL